MFESYPPFVHDKSTSLASNVFMNTLHIFFILSLKISLFNILAQKPVESDQLLANLLKTKQLSLKILSKTGFWQANFVLHPESNSFFF